MGRSRSFDWDEARRLRMAGWTYTSIGEHLGVSLQSVRMACDDGARERQRQRMHENDYWRTGSCIDCGAPVTKYRPGSRCRSCDTKNKATTVRDDTLLCTRCDRWLPDADFPQKSTSPSRRGRHHLCRSCQTVEKREYRERTRQPCSSCGIPVDAVNRRDRTKPLECLPCAMQRVHAERRQAA